VTPFVTQNQTLRESYGNRTAETMLILVLRAADANFKEINR
jgi:hypothetical protein